ncbi:MAG TPA: hypothetical protein PLY08_03715 [Bacillota bacterium]|nr:hypothetical protein [Bacillota bacterium]
MKAVIVEIKKRTAAVLLDDGRVEKIRNSGYTVGQVIDVGRGQIDRSKRLAVRVASLVAVMAIGSGGAFAYYTPYYYVSFDVNPSFEYSVNYFDRVLSARALDENPILDEEELKMLNNKKIEQAVTETLEQIRVDGYLSERGDSGILIAISGTNEERTDKLGVSLQQAVESKTEAEQHIDIETSSIDQEDVREAKDLGVSAGKLHLVEKLEESTEAGAIERAEWLSKPVKEIMDAIKENKEEEKENKQVKKEKDKKN